MGRTCRPPRLRTPSPSDQGISRTGSVILCLIEYLPSCPPARGVEPSWHDVYRPSSLHGVYTHREELASGESLTAATFAKGCGATEIAARRADGPTLHYCLLYTSDA